MAKSRGVLFNEKMGGTERGTLLKQRLGTTNNTSTIRNDDTWTKRGFLGQAYNIYSTDKQRGEKLFSPCTAERIARIADKDMKVAIANAKKLLVFEGYSDEAVKTMSDADIIGKVNNIVDREFKMFTNSVIGGNLSTLA